MTNIEVLTNIVVDDSFMNPSSILALDDYDRYTDVPGLVFSYTADNGEEKTYTMVQGDYFFKLSNNTIDNYDSTEALNFVKNEEGELPPYTRTFVHFDEVKNEYQNDRASFTNRILEYFKDKI